MNKNQPIPTFLSEPEEPIRAELFSLERLEQHAESLAAAQAVTSKPAEGRPLIPRVMENGRVLLDSYRAIARAIQDEQAITPAAEWLVDNFHIVDEQLREIRDDLPAGLLPQAAQTCLGSLAGLSARVRSGVGICGAHGQPIRPGGVAPLRERPISGCSRSRSASFGRWPSPCAWCWWKICAGWRSGSCAAAPRARKPTRWPTACSGTGEQSAILPALQRLEKSPLETAFAVQLVQRLRDLDPKVGPVLLWLDQRLADAGTTADEIVRAEHQQQGAMSVSVRNIITSMRLISAFDWQEFFESVSLVDEILRNDTNFADMDFSTRDDYRHAIEDLSRGSSYSEIEVAKRVVRRVKQAIPASRAKTASGDKPNARASSGARLLPDFARAPGL